MEQNQEVTLTEEERAKLKAELFNIEMCDRLSASQMARMKQIYAILRGEAKP